MKKLTKRVKTLLATSVAMLGCVIGGAFAVQSVNEVVHAETIGSYVEMYSPANANQSVSVTDNHATKHLSAGVVDCEKTESGKGLLLEYTAGNTSAVTATLSVALDSVESSVEGLAIWVDIPKTTEEYSFSLAVENKAVSTDAYTWMNLQAGYELTLIDTDTGSVGLIQTQKSQWKKLELNGFCGWLMIPIEAFANVLATPTATIAYKLDIRFETGCRTTDMQMTVGSFGYYTDYDSFVAEKVGYSYTSLYNPATKVSAPSTPNATYIETGLVDYPDSPTDKALNISYIDATNTSSPYVTVPLTIPNRTFDGLAMWLDIPKTADESNYSFSLILNNSGDWRELGATELTLLNTDGTVTTQTTKSKKQYLNGFKGWLMIPASAFPNINPIGATVYNIMYQYEANVRTTPMELYVGEIGYYTNANAFIFEKCNQQAYVEGYAPTNEIESSNGSSLDTSVEDNTLSPTGKVLKLAYTAGHSSGVTLTVPMTVNAVTPAGFAMWVDIPTTGEEYSFSLALLNPSNWDVPQTTGTMTLISTDGSVTTKKAPWKRMRLDGFTGWLMLSAEAFSNITPVVGQNYSVLFQFEGTTSDLYRTKNLTMSIGSMGWYTDADAFICQTKMTNTAWTQIDEYVEKSYNLVAKTEEQEAIKAEMLSYYKALRAEYTSLSLTEQKSAFCNLQSSYDNFMEEFLYGDIRQQEMIMSFALMSDPHFHRTNTGGAGIQGKLISALNDAKTLNPNLAGAFILGDLSDVGVASRAEDQAKTDLSVYYDWLKGTDGVSGFQVDYTNASGNQIPIVNIMGNHDVRGPIIDGYYPSGGAGYDTANAYPLAVEMYKQREGVESIQFDTWINGYHFVFLNTDFAERDVIPTPTNPTVTHTTAKDDCILSWQTIDWLDETLSQNEDGKPMFIMVHQPKGKVYAEKGSAMTFEQLLAKHPTAVVISGHEHLAFGNDKRTQWLADDGEGVYINQPDMQATSQYYYVEVYEDGVIFRAREVSTDSWLVENDIVVKNANTSIAGSGVATLSKELGNITYTDEELAASGWDGTASDSADKLALYETAFKKSDIKYYIASSENGSAYEQKEFYKLVTASDAHKYKYTHVNKQFWVAADVNNETGSLNLSWLTQRRIGNDGRLSIYNRGNGFDYVHAFGWTAPTDGVLTIPAHTLTISGLDESTFYMGWSLGEADRATMSPTDSTLNLVDYTAIGTYPIAKQTFNVKQGQVVYLNLYAKSSDNSDTRVEIKYDPTFQFNPKYSLSNEIGKIEITQEEIEVSGLIMTDGILGIDNSPATTELTAEQLQAKETAYKNAFEKSNLKFYAAIADSKNDTNGTPAYLQKEYWQWAVDQSMSSKFSYTDINGISAGHHGVNKDGAQEGVVDDTDRFTSDAAGTHVIFTDEGKVEDGVQTGVREYVWSFGWTAPEDGILVIPAHSITLLGGGVNVTNGYLLLGYSHDAVADGLRTTISPDDTTHGWVKYDQQKTYSIAKQVFSVKKGDMVYINMCAKIHSMKITGYTPSFEFQSGNTGVAKSTTVTTKSELGLNYYVAMAPNTERVFAQMQMEGQDAIIVEGVYNTDNGLWKFTYPTIAQYYDREVDLKIVAVDDDSTDMPVSLVKGLTQATVNGKTVYFAHSNVHATGDEVVYSVKQYTDAIVSAETTGAITEELKVLADNLANFCESAKVHFNTPSTAEKVTENVITAEDLKENYKAKLSGSDENVALTGFSLRLLDKTAIHIYFSAPDDKTVVTVQNKVQGTDYFVEKVVSDNPAQENWYVVQILLSAQELSDMQTITIGGLTLEYGAYSYIVSSVDKAGASLYNVLQALYDYSVAADTYFETKEN